MTSIKSSLRAAAKVHVSSSHTFYSANRPICHRLPIPAARLSATSRHSLSWSAREMHTVEGKRAKEEAGKNTEPRTSEHGERASSKEEQENGDTDKESRLGFREAEDGARPQEKDDVDEEWGKARVERILGFVPKRIMPKGDKIINPKNMATEFGSEPPKEEDDLDEYDYDLDEDEEDAEIERLLGFKPKPLQEPKGSQKHLPITDIVTDFESDTSKSTDIDGDSGSGASNSKC